MPKQLNGPGYIHVNKSVCIIVSCSYPQTSAIVTEIIAMLSKRGCHARYSHQFLPLYLHEFSIMRQQPRSSSRILVVICGDQPSSLTHDFRRELDDFCFRIALRILFSTDTDKANSSHLHSDKYPDPSGKHYQPLSRNTLRASGIFAVDSHELRRSVC